MLPRLEQTMIRGVHHVAYVLRELEPAIATFQQAFGATVVFRETLPEAEGIEEVVLRAGEARIELIRPYREGTEYADFLRDTGGGLHHVSFEAPGLDQHAAALRAAGVAVVPPGAYRSLPGWRVLNLDSRTTHRTVSQLSEG
jgi:catechol 2,3-dioxygenase-like lactoylglutathione lyase family enzyme